MLHSTFFHPVRRTSWRLVCVSLSVIALLACCATVSAESTPDPEQQAEETQFFEMKVRPLLAKHCFSCHGADDQKSDLRVDQKSHFFRGGSSGPIVEPGKPEESVLIEAIKWESYEMPPEKQMPEDEIAILEEWVRRGAFWPESTQEVRSPGDEFFTPEDRQWWAFQPVVRPAVPEVNANGQANNPIDHFILAKLAETGIPPAPQASRAELIRRVYYDLLGIPPTVAELEAFLNNPDENAYEQLVDQLLADPRYGQRWAMHWLDLVRYADSEGYRADGFRPLAWRYRDYVVQSFNEDKSYKQFILEQLAGDEIAPNDPVSLAATGFLRHGVYEYNSRDAATHQTLIIDELTDTIGDVFLGMGMACARCHNHKFDPILRDDYYRLQAFLKPAVWKDAHPLVTPEELQAYEAEVAQWSEKHRELLDQLDAIEREPRQRMSTIAVDRFLPEIRAMYRKPEAEKDSYDQQIAYLLNRQIDFDLERLRNGIPKDQRPEWEELKKKLLAAEKELPPAPPKADIVIDAPGPIAPTQVPGDRRNRDIEPGVLTILQPEPLEIDRTLVQAPDSSGRRTTLAQWLARDDNPLTTRVIVNRVWQYHFGSALSAISSDFGRLGEAPSHPELLDWLTSEFVESGWHFKPLHRQILLSATYQQTSLTSPPENALLQDPKNRLLWRYPGRRLDAEQIRDAMLMVSGELRAKDSGDSISSTEPVRSLYTRKMRNSPDPLLATFDSPNGFSSVAQRNSTTTATQSLLMFNGAWVLKRAEAMATRLTAAYGEDKDALIRQAYLECFGRLPSETELATALNFLQTQTLYNEQLAKERAREVVSSALMDEPQMQRWQTAFNINDKTSGQFVALPNTQSLPSGNFTVEAIIYHRTMFKDAGVRTIAAQWNGDNNTRGWSLGVTSETSGYRPRNLIMQLIGDTAEGTVAYVVVPSNIRIPSDKPYYVGAAVDFEKQTVTFYARDMSYDESELEVVTVDHKITGGCRDPNLQFTIGARHNLKTTSNWDGLIDDVRITRDSISDEAQILINNTSQPVNQHTVALWRFVRSDPRGPLSEFTNDALDLQLMTVNEQPTQTPAFTSLTDYCHVLLNSSEFQFAD